MGVAGTLALILAALFTGAAFYVSFAEHPARMKLDPAHAVAQWSPSYDRGYAMQATLAILSGVAGLFAWWQLGGTLWLAGALLMLANWPWTLLVIMPVNKRLKAGAGEETTSLLNRWARLHAVRTLLSFAAMTCFAVAAQALR
jgi:uncharacterized membrane protein